MEGEMQSTVAPTPVGGEAAHRRDLSVAGQYLTRLLSVVTVAALVVLVLVAWRVSTSGDDSDMTGLTMPMLLVGLFWLGTFLASVWMVHAERSGISLALVVTTLGAAGYALRVAVPPDSASAPMYFDFGAGELAVELQFSLICAAVMFVVWAVWASMPVARRTWSRPAVAVLGIGIVALLFVAWTAVPSYPSYMD